MLRAAILTTLILATASAFASACERDESLRAERAEIAGVYTRFLGAAANARLEELDGYWSDLCSETQRQQQEATLRTARASLDERLDGQPIEFVVLLPDQFVFERIDLLQVRVPAEQPAGVLEMRVGDESMPLQETGTSVTLLREDGQWKVGTCDVFSQLNIDEGPMCAEVPTVMAGTEATPVTVPTPTPYPC
jgi:hypothetical protein